MTSEILYSVKGPKNLFEMTWEEVSEVLKETDIVILPVGSTEEHGPFLPLGADSMQGTYIAKRVVEKLGKEGIKVVAAPTIRFGLSHQHVPFPGTIAIRPSTLVSLIMDICKSLHTHGFRKFVLLVPHDGNLMTVNYVVEGLASSLPESKIIVPNYAPIMVERYPEVLTSDRPTEEAHAGEAETARVLVHHPKLVEMKRAKVVYRKEPQAGRPHVVTGQSGLTSKDPLRGTPIGSCGNPFIATKETGEKLYEIVVNWLCEVIKAEFI